MVFHADPSPARSACRRNASPSRLILLACTLQQGCAAFAFAPQRSSCSSGVYSPVPPLLGDGHGTTCFHGIPQTPRERIPTAGTGVSSSLLLGSVSSDGMPDVSSSFAQTSLADQEASGRTTNERKWWKRFGELEEYKREHGHCNVPQGYKENPQLANWVDNQRTAYRSNKLSSERVKELERIGFEWIGPKTGRKADDALWSKRLNELEEYKREHGHCNVPRGYKENPQLATWVNNQRLAYNQNKMSSERVEALERIGFEWIGPKTGRKADDALWSKRLNELEEYKREHGHWNVPQRYKENPQLGNWVNTQRTAYNQNKMSSERVEALERIGFEWIGQKRKPDDASWWRRLKELEEYKREHGHCNVPRGYNGNPQLANWVNNQRTACRSNNLSSEQVKAFNSIGFERRLRERPEWDERYEELLSYKETHGDTLVPMDARKNSTKKRSHLATWVQTQREQYRLLREGKPSHLNDVQIEKLDSIGFVWDAQEHAWDNRLNELKEFKATHGHTDVPASWRNQFLHRWVSKQRTHHKAFQDGKATWITEERIEKLESIGFEWKSMGTYKWKIRFGELRDFYNKYGVGPIPRTESQLYVWVRKQKKEYDKYISGVKTNMDEERIKDLESIGFFYIYGK